MAALCNVVPVCCRYCSKSDLVDVHQKSEPFLNFKNEMLALDPYLRKEGSGLVETGIGHMIRLVQV